MDEELSNILKYKPNENEDYYSILGCDELSSKEQIIAEYKARVLLCHPDKHPNNPTKALEFERIQTARDTLCDDEKRANYDKWRHAGISMSFNKWCNMRGAVHTSMHWMTPKKETMIEACQHDTTTSSSSITNSSSQHSSASAMKTKVKEGMTEHEVMLAVQNCLKYAPDRRGGDGRKKTTP